MAGFDWREWARLSAGGYAAVGCALQRAESGEHEFGEWDILRCERTGGAGVEGAASVARAGRGRLVQRREHGRGGGGFDGIADDFKKHRYARGRARDRKSTRLNSSH